MPTEIGEAIWGELRHFRGPMKVLSDAYRRISLGTTKVIGPRLHHQIPVIGRPFLQRNEARRQRDQAQQERDEARMERDNARKELDFLRAQIERDGFRRELDKIHIETVDASQQGDVCQRELDNVRIQLRPTFWIERIGCNSARGWIFSDSYPIERVFAKRDGQTIAETSSFFSRPDVAAVYPNSNFAERSGFSLFFDIPAAGQRSMVSIFSEQAGTEFLLGERLTGLPPGTDLLKSHKTREFQLEFTSRCNLRCVYCAVSQPDYVGRDMPTEDFDRLVEDLKARRVEQVLINGHGETTLLPDWQEKVRKIAYHGLNMSIISNFARLMSDAELEAMAHVANIQVSIDTHRADLLQKLRRKVDVRNILTNMVRVRAAASRLGIPKPKFSWSCVITDKNAFDLVDYVHFALACGVREVSLCNLTKYDDVDGALNVDHVTTMPQDKLARFAGMIEEARAILSQAGGQLFVMAGLEDAIADTLSQRGVQLQWFRWAQAR